MHAIHEDPADRTTDQMPIRRKSDQLPSQQCVVRLVWRACALTCAVTEHDHRFLFK